MIFGSTNTVVGVDIGTSSVKLVGLSKTRKGYTLESLGIAPLPRDCVIDGEIYNIGAVSKVLRDLVKSSKSRGAKAFTGVFGSDVIIKRIKVPLMPKKELENHIRWEAEQYIPFNIDEVNLDYDVISPNYNKTGKMDLIIAAAKKDQVSAYSAVLCDSGLIPEGVDIGSIALYDMFKENYGTASEEAILIVDIGASHTRINMIENNRTVFLKEIDFAGEYFTRKIQDALNVSFEEGETLKISSEDGMLTSEVEKILIAEMKKLATEVKKNIDIYLATSSELPIGEMSIVGGCVKMLGINQVLEAITGVPVSIINPFKNIAFNEDIFPSNYLAQVSPFFGVAIGTAIRGLRY